MSVWDSMRAWTLAARQTVSGKPAATTPQEPIWLRWLNSVESGIKSFIDGPLGKWVTANLAGTIIIQRIELSVIHAIERVIANVLNALKRWLQRLIYQLADELRKLIARNYRTLVTMILRALYIAKEYAYGLVAKERRYRIAADIRLDHEIKTRIKWLHQQLEREAVSAYRAQRGQQNSVITRLLDLVINLNPILRPLVSDLIKGILDLAAVDDPVARIALGFLLRQVVDRLGLDKPIGDLIHNLLTSILGQGKPTDIHAVLADMCARLAAGETQWAQFYTDGGSEVEQAGTQWQDITRWTTDAALLGLFGVMAVEPARFASDVTGALAAFVHDTINTTHALIKGA